LGREEEKGDHRTCVASGPKSLMIGVPQTPMLIGGRLPKTPASWMGAPATGVIVGSHCDWEGGPFAGVQHYFHPPPPQHHHHHTPCNLLFPSIVFNIL